MNQWTPENIAAICTAVAAVITAVGAAIHSMNTRKGITGVTNESESAKKSS